MESASSALEKHLEKRHTYVTKEDTVVLAEAKGKSINLEGYLFKRGQSAFRTWNRRWFYIDANKVIFGVISLHFVLFSKHKKKRRHFFFF